MASRSPSKFEFDLLAYLAQHDGLTVRQIFDDFGRSKGYVRGTVVKAMDRLYKKGRVSRELAEGAFIYRTVQGTEDLDRQLVESFIRDRLGGRLTPLAAFLSEAEDLDPEELRKLKELLEDKEP